MWLVGYNDDTLTFILPVFPGIYHSKGPFRGGGLWFFLGGGGGGYNGKFDGETNSCPWHGQKKYSESTLCLKKRIFVGKK